MDNIVVVFTSNNARVLRNPEDIEQLRLLPNVLVNPDFKYVKGIPPHLWTINGNGDLVGLGRYKRSLKQAHIDSALTDNNIKSPCSFKVKPSIWRRMAYRVKVFLGRFV